MGLNHVVSPCLTLRREFTGIEIATILIGRSPLKQLNGGGEIRNDLETTAKVSNDSWEDAPLRKQLCTKLGSSKGQEQRWKLRMSGE